MDRGTCAWIRCRLLTITMMKAIAYLTGIRRTLQDRAWGHWDRVDCRVNRRRESRRLVCRSTVYRREPVRRRRSRHSRSLVWRNVRPASFDRSEPSASRRPAAGPRNRRHLRCTPRRTSPAGSSHVSLSPWQRQQQQQHKRFNLWSPNLAVLRHPGVDVNLMGPNDQRWTS